VCSHYRPIDAPKIFIQLTTIYRILGKAINYSLKRPITIPAIEMLKHGLPSTEFRRQITPFGTSVVYPDHGLKHLSRIRWRSACRCWSGKNVFNDIPLFITQSMTHNWSSCSLSMANKRKLNQDQFRNRA
jgi:hypothetical protein